MTLNLPRLRRLAEESRIADTQLKQRPDASSMDTVHDAEAELYAALRPDVVLELLDRLERAEDRLVHARAHWRITAGTTYAMSGMGRILGEEGER
jgi:hypothetical protein